MAGKPTKEFCTNQNCTTPNCPYKKHKNAECQQDYSTECDYYTPSGDGRYTKPLIRNV